LQLISFDYYAELLTWLGEPEDAKRWSAEADKMRQSLKRFWSEEKGMFAENMNGGTIDSNFSEHANALAIEAGVATAKQTALIIEKIINNRENPVMEESVLFNYWVVEAMCNNGYVTEGIDYLKKHYAHMLVDGENGTLWEYANLYAQNKGSRYTGAKDKFEGRSWCTAQGENGFPGIILSRWVLGLNALTPGQEKIKITSFLSPYSEFSGVLPTPKGVIKIKREENKLTLFIPEGIEAVLKHSDLKQVGAQHVQINKEKPVLISGLKEDIVLKGGQYIVRMIE
jgi:hypothetical protein